MSRRHRDGLREALRRCGDDSREVSRQLEHDASFETHYFLLVVFILGTSLLCVLLALITCCKGRRREIEGAGTVKTQDTKLIACETTLWISTGGKGVCFHVDPNCVGLHKANALRQLRACRLCVEHGSRNCIMKKCS